MASRTTQIGVLLILLGVVAMSAGLMAFWSEANVRESSQIQITPRELPPESSTADHRKFEVLNRDFASGPEVTRACLSCHTEAARQIQGTIHWTWLCPYSDDRRLGKAGLIVNNFCISIHSNEPRCTMCHVGYGWKDKNFDFKAEELVDCLVCHEQTGTYEKVPGGAGHPAKETTEYGGHTYSPPDWKKAAQSVTRPKRKNCGACHFSGGGGDGVKHGDLDSSMLQPPRDVDVHMSPDKLGFECTRCHTTRNHSISGRCYGKPAGDRKQNILHDDQVNRICCESCHTDSPHSNARLNHHTDKVACQTCHIPFVARVNPTVIWWDYSKAGRMDSNGNPIKIKNEFGKPSYASQKGEFIWAKNVSPVYRWYNGAIKNVTILEKIDPDSVIQLNSPQGQYEDPRSRIAPFKLSRGKQVYDSVNRNMVIPKLHGEKGSGAYWVDFDWKASVTVAMDYVGVPFSGEYGFVETEYFVPISHMVAPKEQALTCSKCHNITTALAGLTGFYLPGRDRSPLLDRIGWGVIVCSVLLICLREIICAVRGMKERMRRKRYEPIMATERKTPVLGSYGIQEPLGVTDREIC